MENRRQEHLAISLQSVIPSLDQTLRPHLRPAAWPPSRPHFIGKHVSDISVSLEETQAGRGYGRRGRGFPTGAEKVETHFGEEAEEK
jgi:hypothetical protein